MDTPRAQPENKTSLSLAAKSRVLALQAHYAAMQGDHESSLAASGLALRNASSVDSTTAFLALESRVIALTNATRFEEALHVADLLSAMDTIPTSVAMSARAHWVRGRLFLALGEWDNAESMLSLACRETASTAPMARASVMLLCRLRTWTDRVLEAYATADYLEKTWPDSATEAELCRAEADLAKGDTKSASKRLRHVLPYLTDHIDRRRMWSLTIASEIALLEGDADEALRMVTEATIHHGWVEFFPPPSYRLAAALILRGNIQGIKSLTLLDSLAPHERLVRMRLGDFMTGSSTKTEERLKRAPERIAYAFKKLQYRLGLTPRPSLRLVTTHGISMVSTHDIIRERPGNADMVFDARTGILKTFTGCTIDMKRKRREARLLEFLMSNPGQYFSRSELFENVWMKPFNPEYHDNDVYVLIHRLRKLVGDSGNPSRVIIRDAETKGYGMTDGTPTWALIKNSFEAGYDVTALSRAG